MPPHEVERGLLAWFFPGLTPADLEHDQRPLKLLKHLSELYSLHNAAIALATDRPAVLLAVYYHFLDWICHDYAEFAPPRRPDVCAADFTRYSEALARACELQDLLLGDLLRAAGPDTSVLLVSDHGFLSGEARPTRTPGITAGIAAWHRPEGILVASGPLFHTGGQRVRGARLFDLAPTVLHALGLPVGRDLPGRVLETVAARPAPVAWLPSWETTPPSHPLPAAPASPPAQDGVLDDFAALGYVSTPDADPAADNTTLLRDLAWNLGHALLHADRLEEALAQLETAWFHAPELPHLATALARCQARLGLVPEAQTTLAAVRDFVGASPAPDLLLAELRLQFGAPAETLEHLRRAAALGAPPATLRFHQSCALLQLKRLDEAHALAAEWAAAEPSSPLPSLLRARAFFREQDYDADRPLAQARGASHPELPLAWFTLGQIERRSGQPAAAEAAHARALALRPDFTFARAGQRLAAHEKHQAEDASRFLTLPHLDFAALLAEPGQPSPAALASHARLRAASRARLATLAAARSARRATTAPVDVFSPPLPPAAPAVIVSGLPRSGTSLLMQMLAAAGLPPKTDGLRPPDAHNPRGFFEWEPIKTLAQNPGRLREAAGHAVKVVSSQLAHVPPDSPCRVLWIDRDIAEIAASQEKMLRALHPERALEPLPERHARLARHRDETLAQAATRAHPLLRISHARLLREPAAIAGEIAAFLGPLLPRPEAMPACVDPTLHREKGESAP